MSRMNASAAVLVLTALCVTSGASGQTARLECAAFTSGGSVSPNGTVLVLGQPFVGVAAAGPVTLTAGIVPCLVSVGACPADFDGSGEVNANDISAYLNGWYADIVSGATVADFDRNGETNANDISAFINAWYAAVTNGGSC